MWVQSILFFFFFSLNVFGSTVENYSGLRCQICLDIVSKAPAHFKKLKESDTSSHSPYYTVDKEDETPPAVVQLLPDLKQMVCNQGNLSKLENPKNYAMHMPTVEYDCTKFIDTVGSDLENALSFDENLNNFCLDEGGCRRKEIKRVKEATTTKKPKRKTPEELKAESGCRRMINAIQWHPWGQSPVGSKLPSKAEQLATRVAAVRRRLAAKAAKTSTSTSAPPEKKNENDNEGSGVELEASDEEKDAENKVKKAGDEKRVGDDKKTTTTPTAIENPDQTQSTTSTTPWPSTTPTPGVEEL